MANVLRQLGKGAALAIGLALASTASAQDPEFVQVVEPVEPGSPRQYIDTATPLAPHNKIEQRREDEARKFASLTSACEQGDPSACGDLGEAYELGEGTGQNRPIAALLYSEACDAGDAESCYRLGRVTFAAVESDADQAAFEALNRACDLGSFDGCAGVAQAYEAGGPVAQDRELAASLRRQTCERGGAGACISYAISISDADPEFERRNEVVALLEQACRDGEAVGCNTLLSYEAYDEALIGYPSGADLHRLACDAGDKLNCLSIGDITFHGDGSYRDYEGALVYYDRACYLDPLLCRYAENVRAEPREYDACQNDDNSACARLAEIYVQPGTVLTDPNLARAYFEYACYAGATEACAQAGLRALDGDPNPTAARKAQAIAYLERGCDADDMPACYMLAGHYERGDIVAQSLPRSYQIKAKLCANDYRKECQGLQEAYADDPAIPLTEAGPLYTPPPEDGAPPATEETFVQVDPELGPACVKSEIVFRGKLYTDEVCRSVNRVVGARAIAPGSAPWQALIWRPERAFGQNLEAFNRVLCGGSLIAEGWILTAAHCLRDDGGWITRRGYTVRLGVFDPHEEQGIAYPITRVYRHPEYNPRTYAFDIALVRFDHSAGRRDGRTYAIASIATDEETMEERVISRGDPVYVYGFGRTVVDDARSTAPLQGAKLLLESQAQCNVITQFARTLWNTMLCAKGANNEQACKGDSGGPLITYSDADRRPRVIGVVSSGRRCGQGRTREASRYVRVAAAREWIDETMGLSR